jgi:uncharacterized membrane protein
MTFFLVLLLAALIGVVAGLRAVTAPAVLSWATVFDWINLDGTWAEWMAHPITVTVLTILAVAELVTDKLSRTPSRRTPMQFVTRLLIGGFAGAVLTTGAILDPTAWEIIAGVGAAWVGAVLGTLGGAEGRRSLVARNEGYDLPVALTEDAIAVLGGFSVAALASVI